MGGATFGGAAAVTMAARIQHAVRKQGRSHQATWHKTWGRISFVARAGDASMRITVGREYGMMR